MRTVTAIIRRWMRLLFGIAPVKVDPDEWSLARVHADTRYTGATADEPHLAAKLTELIAELRCQYRTDQEWRDAQVASAAAERDLARAQGLLAEAEQSARQARERGAVDGDSVHERALRTERYEAAATRQQAADDVTEARQALAAAAASLADGERQTIDRLITSATARLQDVNRLVGVFNLARNEAGLPPLGLLGDDTLAELIRAAVRPLQLTDVPQA